MKSDIRISTSICKYIYNMNEPCGYDVKSVYQGESYHCKMSSGINKALRLAKRELGLSRKKISYKMGVTHFCSDSKYYKVTIYRGEIPVGVAELRFYGNYNK